MKLLMIGLLLAVFTHHSFGVPGYCRVSGFEGLIELLNAARDDATHFISLPTQGVVDIEVLSPGVYRFVDVEYTGNMIHFRPSAAFATFEKDSVFTPKPVVSAMVRLMCLDSGEHFVNFNQSIRDINNHLPTFNEDTYTFSVPTSLPADAALTEFGEDIFVTDIDITNDGIDFEIVEENSGLSVEYIGTVDSMQKQHRGVVRTNADLKPTNTVTYTVKATDRGNPTQFSTAKIVIEVQSL